MPALQSAQPIKYSLPSDSISNEEEGKAVIFCILMFRGNATSTILYTPSTCAIIRVPGLAHSVPHSRPMNVDCPAAAYKLGGGRKDCFLSPLPLGEEPAQTARNRILIARHSKET